MIAPLLKQLATTLINHPELSMREKEKIFNAIKKDDHGETTQLYNQYRKKITDILNYKIKFPKQGQEQ